MTTLARTVADLFDRHDLAGGAEELFNSLDLVARVDAVALVRHARARGNAAAAGTMGFWLEREREQLSVPREALEDLRALAPPPAALCVGRKTRVGKDGERLERHRSGRRCRTRLRGALNGAAHRPDTAAARRGDGIPTGYAGERATWFLARFSRSDLFRRSCCTWQCLVCGRFPRRSRRCLCFRFRIRCDTRVRI